MSDQSPSAKAAQQIQRFNIVADKDGWYKHEPSETGPYMLHADHLAALSDSLRPYRALAAKLRKLPVDEWSAETCGAVARIADEIDALSNKEAGK